VLFERDAFGGPAAAALVRRALAVMSRIALAMVLTGPARAVIVRWVGSALMLWAARPDVALRGAWRGLGDLWLSRPC
jgi:hypothetical protein